MIRFSRDKVLLLHQLMIAETGGAADVRDFGLLESALERAYASFVGQELYPTKEEKGARIGYALISNHAFVDGNKRAGALLLGVLLRREGRAFRPDASDLLHVIMGVAAGSKGYWELLSFVRQETGER